MAAPEEEVLAAAATSSDDFAECVEEAGQAVEEAQAEEPPVAPECEPALVFCATATASALANLAAASAPATPSPPKAKASSPRESSDGHQCLLDQSAAPPPPPAEYPYLTALMDVVRQSHVLAGAAVGIAAGLAYSLKLSSCKV